ncbi:olfactory receptor 9G4-like [Alligator mississippiensis]|uniref:olfactory receptor 9G4-like n=1 Tax=Alligator mississippiensis TaxID=8496 RepID=UPI002877AA9A|nr:olfactory receptor 9G4-like [Alligator mississippiensis]
MEKEGNNQTLITEFILLGFGNVQQYRILLFLLFLVIYIVTVAGNVLIIVLVATDQHLHTPMYFFLGNLSCLETFYISTILPRMLASFLSEDKTISVRGCIAQFYIFDCLAAIECYLLAVMSYDRYLAICKPLLYPMLMNSRVCRWLAAGSWIGGILLASTIMYFTAQLTFCGSNVIDHFFCDLTPILERSCSDTSVITLVSSVVSFFVEISPFLLTMTSYICIIVAILRIPSTSGRKKAFSTCSSHLVVVTVFYGTLTFVYLSPKNSSVGDLNKVFSVFYTVLTPLVNPLIYSLRNREVKEALRKAVSKLCPSQGDIG